MDGTNVNAAPVERLDPLDEGDKLVSAEHLARYWWASTLVRGREVLDAACGVGYGTHILASAGAATAVGIDIAPDALAHARDSDARAEFVEGDLGQLPFADASFDVVVCFEALEHVEDPSRALDELRRVVRPGGLVVVSSPNRGVYPAGNPFHVFEYTAEELAEELGSRFPHVHMFRQHPFLASAVVDDAGFASDASTPTETSLYKLVPRSPGDEMYTLAVASDEPVDSPPGLVALADGFELQWWHDELTGARRATAAAEDARARLEEQLRTGGKRLLELESEVAMLQERRRLLEEDAERGWHEARKSWRHYEELEARMLSIQHSPSWRVTRPLRTAKRFAKQALRR